MARRNSVRLGFCALMIALAAFLLMGMPGFAVPEALAEQDASLLRVSVTVRPEELIGPGDVMLSFALENISEAEARNVYLSSVNGLIFELVGQIGPGESQTFSRQHSVTAAELDAGEIVYTISHEDPDDANVKVNYTVRAPIRRSDAQPTVEFTRQFSSRSVEADGTVTITYRVRNTGNVPLSDLQVQDALGNYTGRVDALEVGESRALINRAPISETTASSATLRYRAEGSDEILTQALADVEVRIADSDLNSTFTAGYSAFSQSTANVVLTLTNKGNVDYRDLSVVDDVYGGVIADELSLPANGDPLEISRAYSVRGDSGFRWRVTGKSDSGEEVDFLTETIVLPPQEAGSKEALSLSVRALTPRIRREGDVTMRVDIENPGGVELRDVVLSEESMGTLHTFAVLPADGSIQRDITVHVTEDASYSFSLRGSDAEGEVVTALAGTVEVVISSDGVLPEGAQEQLFEFSGGSIKIGGSSTFAVLLLAGIAVLLVLIITLIIATRRARLERQLRIAAERQRRREEMGKTNRFTPVRAPQKNKSKGRNA